MGAMREASSGEGRVRVGQCKTCAWVACAAKQSETETGRHHGRHSCGNRDCFTPQDVDAPVRTRRGGMPCRNAISTRASAGSREITHT
eukprot:2915828-Prymnesium_polylepis.1